MFGTVLFLCGVFLVTPAWAGEEELDNPHALAAEEAVDAGDWAGALPKWKQAIELAEKTGAETAFKAILYYEQGRAQGVLCQWDEAEESLLRAYELDAESGDTPVFLSLTELARLVYARQDYESARHYYEKLVPLLKNYGANSFDPVGYVEILEEYAVALRAGNKDTEAAEYEKQAAELRAALGELPSNTSKTPYGQACATATK
jgi:tetratricopeptide (TPR) repeat protein